MNINNEFWLRLNDCFLKVVCGPQLLVQGMKQKKCHQIKFNKIQEGSRESEWRKSKG